VFLCILVYVNTHVHIYLYIYVRILGDSLEKVRLRNISLRTMLRKLERTYRAREQLAGNFICIFICIDICMYLNVFVFRYIYIYVDKCMYIYIIMFLEYFIFFTHGFTFVM
jgi:hypothetical protein